MTDTETATARVQRAVDLVLADIVRTGVPAREFHVSEARAIAEWRQDADATTVLLDYGGHTFVLDGARSLADLTREIADRVQEDVIDDSGRAWPRAAAAQAPSTAVVDGGGTAVWRTETGVQTEIGHLPAG